MRNLNIVIVSLALAVMAGCDGGLKRETGVFDFSVVADTQRGEAPVRVSLYVERGGEGEFAFEGRVLRSGDGGVYDAVDAVFRSGAEELSQGSAISFMDAGHKDLYIDGLENGTYKVSISLDNGNGPITRSCLFAIIPYKNDGGSIYIAQDIWFTDGFCAEDGLVIDLFSSENPVRHPFVVLPKEVTDKSVDVQVDDEAVVKADVTDGSLSVRALKVGTTTVRLQSGDGAVKRAIRVNVKDSTPETGKVAVTEFTLPALDMDYGRYCLQVGELTSYSPVITPANADDKAFEVKSSDENVVEAWYENGAIRLQGKTPGRTSVVVTAESGKGMTKTLPVLVYQNTTVRIEFQENTPTEAQLKTKVFPCNIRFSSDSAVEFPSPFRFSITMKAVVNLSGHDTQSIIDRRDVLFYGNRNAYYNVTSNILEPSYLIWRDSNYTLAISMQVIYQNPLNPDLWRITLDEAYKTQDSRIGQYIVDYAL